MGDERDKVNHFFAEMLSKQETDREEFFKSVAFSLGASIALEIPTVMHEIVIKDLNQRLNTGLVVGKQLLPIAKNELVQKLGIHVFIVENEK